MAFLDWAIANPQETELLAQNPQALQVLGSIANSIPPVEEAPMEQPAPAMAAPVAQQEPVQEEAPQGEGFLTGLAKGFMNAMSNPDVINTLGAFGASMGNDRQGYESNMNAYVNRLESRRKEEADRQFAQVQNNQRERMAEVNALYDSYTPESVAQFQATGDYSVLVPNKKYELAEGRLGVAQNNSQTSATRAANTQSNADRAYNRNVTNDQLKALDKQAQALEGKSVTLPGGTVVTSAGIYTDTDGTVFRVESNSRGLNAKPVSASEQESRTGASRAGTSAQTKFYEQNLQDARAAAKEDEDGNVPADNYTGFIDNYLPGLAKAQTDWAGGAAKKGFTAAESLKANSGNSAIAAAVAAGASGINTEVERQNYAKSAPDIDYSSIDAYKASIDRLQAYHDNYVTDLLNKYGGNATYSSKGKSAPSNNAATASTGSGGSITLTADEQAAGYATGRMGGKTVVYDPTTLEVIRQ